MNPSGGYIKSLRRFIRFFIPLPLRYGKIFRHTYNFLKKSQYWSKNQIAEYQGRQLESLINHAYDNVPYYRRVFDERGLMPKDIRGPGDLKKLPLLTKDALRGNFKELVAKNFDSKNLKYMTTGGSTGVPVGFYTDLTAFSKEWAFTWRGWNWAGYTFGKRRVSLRGDVWQYEPGIGEEWYKFLPVQNNLILSPFYMNEKSLPEYIDKIRRFRPYAIHCYPSALWLLANFLKDRGETLDGITCALTSSETIYGFQRDLIKKYIGIPVFDLYGNSEKVSRIAQCEKGTYHIMPEYGITEVVSPDGIRAEKDGERGEIIGTGFLNYGMPLIRYATGDIASISTKKCPCGRNFPIVEKIEGRRQDFFVGAGGEFIPMTALNFHSDIFDNVRKFQFYQEKKGEIALNIIKGECYCEKDSRKIREEVLKKLGPGSVLIINFTDNIPLTERGKHKMLIQKLPINFT